jgi:hypothetical protein
MVQHNQEIVFREDQLIQYISLPSDSCQVRDTFEPTERANCRQSSRLTCVPVPGCLPLNPTKKVEV